MPIGLLKNMIATTPRGTALLGMDVGAKTIGLAVCDPEWRVVTPLKTIRRVKFTKDMEIVRVVIKDYEIGGFVIGYPLNMDGSEGPRCQSVRNFAEEMEKFLSSPSPAAPPARLPLPKRERVGVRGQSPWIALFDERLSTVAAEGLVDNLVDINQRRAKDRGITDALAAQTILDRALFYLHKL